ncbi:ComF family protein [Tepidibacillus infernus]|uniref:ComF family protein n=1 Tax=Tepidibacillus infernus TaxID=1806172 RepID=UPI003B73083C
MIRFFGRDVIGDHRTNLLKSYLNAIFYPEHRCLLCEKPIQSHSHDVLQKMLHLPHLCMICKNELEVIPLNHCYQCHKPIDPQIPVDKEEHLPIQEGTLLCHDCIDANHALSFNRSAVLYNDFMKENIALYKYRGKESLSRIFSYLLKIAYDYYYKDVDIDFITFVPLHSSRLKERGFNQAEQLASQLSFFTGKPVYSLLQRIKETEKQSKHGKWERLKQIEGAFIMEPLVEVNLQDKNVLLIDDIYTTGATLEECAQTLKGAGVNQVYSLTLTRAV